MDVVHRAEDDDEAVELANDSPYGLGGSVFGSDVERAPVADRVDSGMVFINIPARGASTARGTAGSWQSSGC